MVLSVRAPLPRPPRGERDDGGAVAVLVAIVVAALVIPLAAIVVDLGYARVQRDQAQTAADAAALAAAARLKTGGSQDEADQVAESSLRQNLSDDAADRFAAEECDGDCLSVSGKSVTVHVPTLPAAPFFAGSAPSVSAAATATWGPVSLCAVCVDGDLSVGASWRSGSVTIGEGNLVVDGNVRSGGWFQLPFAQSSTITTSQGSTLYTGTWDPRVTAVPSAVSRPAVSLPGHSAVTARLRALLGTATPAVLIGRDTCAPPSGATAAYFDDALPVSRCRHFAPGIYLLTPSLADDSVLLGGSTVDGSASDGPRGALFYLTCAEATGHPVACSSASGSAARLNTSAGITLRGLSGAPYPELNGFSVVTDPDNPQQQVFGRLSITGDVYAAHATVSGLTIRGRLISNELTTTATGWSSLVRLPSLNASVDVAALTGPVRLVS